MGMGKNISQNLPKSIVELSTETMGWKKISTQLRWPVASVGTI